MCSRAPSRCAVAANSSRTAVNSATLFDAHAIPPADQHDRSTHHAQPAGPVGLLRAEPSVAAVISIQVTVRAATYRATALPPLRPRSVPARGTDTGAWARHSESAAVRARNEVPHAP